MYWRRLSVLLSLGGGGVAGSVVVDEVVVEVVVAVVEVVVAFARVVGG